MNIGAIILAAGGSARLGSPKQLLVYKGDPLIRRAALAALAACCRPVVVVVGSGAERMLAPLADLNLDVIENASWQEGIGTSIRAGMRALEGELDAVLLMVCDQPFVGSREVDKLIGAFSRAAADHAIAAAEYDGTVGVPAVFGRAHFESLGKLPDEEGAKAILLDHRQEVIAVEMPIAAVDIDTPAQYERLL